MKKEVNMDKYNNLCDKMRSLILYTEAFGRRNKKRIIVIKELSEIVRDDGLELIERVESLEGLVNSLYKTENKDGSKKHNNSS